MLANVGAEPTEAGRSPHTISVWRSDPWRAHQLKNIRMSKLNVPGTIERLLDLNQTAKSRTKLHGGKEGFVVRGIYQKEQAVHRQGVISFTPAC